MGKGLKMVEKKRKFFTKSMIIYELRNVTGNPFVHIFGVGMPVLMSILITRMVVSEISDAAVAKMVSTSTFLGIGALIPLATILMGYSVMQAQDLEKGIPERLQLFGIKNSISICNRAVSEIIFMIGAFFIYFLAGICFIGIETPVFSGGLLYAVCIFIFSVFCFAMGHGLATLIKKFSATYCGVMVIYFAFMIFGGMMGMSYENMSGWMQGVAKLLPVTYFTRDFYHIWTGEPYDFMPMVQSFLFFGAVGGILLFAALKREEKK